MSNRTYNGWSNYETWAVKLWMDNDSGSYDYWRETTREVWRETGDKTPNQFMDHLGNCRSALAERLKDEHDDQSEHPVFAAANGTVYADLLNAALGEVDWHEIAAALMDDGELTEDEPETEDANV